MEPTFSKPAAVFSGAVREVASQPRFAALALVGAAGIGAGMVWLSNHQLLRFVLTSDTFPWSAKLRVFWLSLGSFLTNFTLVSQIMIVLVALLSGINIALFALYFRRRMTSGSTAGASGLGLLIGTLGVGCSACGSVVLSSLVGITSASALASALPLHGVEFGLAGIGIIGWSTYRLAKKVQSPEVCPIPPHI